MSSTTVATSAERLPGADQRAPAVAITGASGFVGANLLRALLAQGCRVTVLLRPGYRPWRLAGLRGACELLACDLGDRAALTTLLQQRRISRVYHLATHGAYATQTDSAAIIGSNLQATIALVDAAAAAGVELFVNSGSSSEYGVKPYAPAEDERLEPDSLYAVTKAAATHYCRMAARRTAMRIVTLRLYSVYGPYEEPTRLLPTLLLHALAGHWPPLVDRRIARDFVAAADVCAAYLAVAERPAAEPGAVYNIGSGQQTTLAELVALSVQLFGVTAEPQWGSMANRGWDTDVWVADVRKAQAELGWQAQTALVDGLLGLRDWLIADRERMAYYQQQIFGGGELRAHGPTGA
jgi:UDP-glucose 4-epimerase